MEEAHLNTTNACDKSAIRVVLNEEKPPKNDTKIKHKTRLYTFSSLIMFEILGRAIRQENEIQGLQQGRKKSKYPYS